MAVNITGIVQPRVTQILNAATQAADGSATYVTTVTDDRRHATDILDACTGAGCEIILAICETPLNGYRAGFMADSASILHGGKIPDHCGPIGIPKIQRYTGGTFDPGHQKSEEDIQSMRDNTNSLYDSIAHNLVGSMLGGYYAVRDNLLFYTGFDAKIPIATFVRADTATKIPDAFESAVIALAVSMLIKEGDSEILLAYIQRGQQYLAQIRSGAMILEPQLQAQKAA